MDESNWIPPDSDGERRASVASGETYNLHSPSDSNTVKPDQTVKHALKKNH